MPSISSPQQPEIEGLRDPVQAKLMEQNMVAHNLAYKIQQAFVQARIEGIGKPFQVKFLLCKKGQHFFFMQVTPLNYA